MNSSQAFSRNRMLAVCRAPQDLLTWSIAVRAAAALTAVQTGLMSRLSASLSRREVSGKYCG